MGGTFTIFMPIRSRVEIRMRSASRRSCSILNQTNSISFENGGHLPSIKEYIRNCPPSLVELYIEDVEIDENTIVTIRNLPKLTSLALVDCMIDQQDDLRLLLTHSRITELNLS